MKASPVLTAKDVTAGLERLIRAGDFRRGAGVNVLGVGVRHYPEELASIALAAKARRRPYRHPVSGEPDVSSEEIMEFFVRLR